jgi:hypothetical protein
VTLGMISAQACDRLLLFVVIVGVFGLNVTGVITAALALGIQACAVAYTLGAMVESRRSSRAAIAAATVATETRIADLDAALAEGEVPDEHIAAAEHELEVASKALAVLDSMTSPRERRRRRKEHP